MTGNASESADEPDVDDGVEWPVEVRGVTESIVSTLGPNGRWNHAALGLYEGDPVTARTWGNTRTRRNFAREGGGYVQFTRDPVAFVDAALSIVERDDPVLESADAWVAVSVERLDRGERDGTTWEEWAIRPVDGVVRQRTVFAHRRGYAAVVEASVAASRLDVDAYDTPELLDRLRYLEDVVERCGSQRDCEAFDRIDEFVAWTSAGGTD